MNTASVAELLGVSQSTVKRWIKQLGLRVELNELGHFHFRKEDIEVLKQIQQCLQKGMLLSDIRMDHNEGKIAVTEKKTSHDELFNRIKQLERKIDGKADDVVSYQLMTHRKDLDELEKEITRLNEKIFFLEKQMQMMNDQFASGDAEQMKQERSAKKKGILTMLFGV